MSGSSTNGVTFSYYLRGQRQVIGSADLGHRRLALDDVQRQRTLVLCCSSRDALVHLHAHEDRFGGRVLQEGFEFGLADADLGALGGCAQQNLASILERR